MSAGPRIPPATDTRLAGALAAFGWEVDADFWRRYYSDAWVYNLANALEALAGEVERLTRQVERLTRPEP